MKKNNSIMSSFQTSNGSSCSNHFNLSLSGGTAKNARELFAFDIGILVPKLGMRIWTVIGYITRTFLVHTIRNLNSQCYISPVLNSLAVSYLRDFEGVLGKKCKCCPSCPYLPRKKGSKTFATAHYSFHISDLTPIKDI
ncbi:hypothetical protein TNCV_4873031 [Trichonephila clavipes]|nr:hypothetical protein TNCV_4873031 [Trichonephila clavipes]